MKWKVDEEKTAGPAIEWLDGVCQDIAKDVESCCKDHVLICTGGPYRNADVSIKYDEDKRKFIVDFYSVIRLDSREHAAVNYAKGLLKEACLTRSRLEREHPDDWKGKFTEWKQGMWKLSGEEQMDELMRIIGNKKGRK